MKAAVPVVVAALLVGQTPSAHYHVLIKGAHIVDGTGNPWYPGDIGIENGRIRAIRASIDAPADTVIDARGLTVTPGFIDMHTHSDYTLLRDGNGESKIRQGVTLEVIGEGSSAAPRKPAFDEDLRGAGVTDRWTTFREYFDLLERKGVSVNLMSYVSAGQLRRMVIGDVFRRPTAPELEEMKRLARQAMEDGALGLVAALETTTGAHPDAVPGTDELVELASAVAPYGGLYGTHMRNQTDHFIDAIDEVGAIAARARISGEIFHIKSAGKPYFGQMARALEEIRSIRRRGLDVGADVYPYIAASHGLATEVAQWAKDGGREKFIARLKDPALRPRLRKETDEYIETKYYNEEKKVGGYAAVMIASTEEPNDPAVGKTIAQIAAERHVSGADAALDLLAENHGNVGIVMFYMSEADMRLALADPDVSICSDGSAISPAFGGKPHPRYYGTFPRILGKYVREEKVLRLEDAVRKMTSLAAQRLGLRDRGVLREGSWADIVIFDPATIVDRATFEDPHQYPSGIEYVLVNGSVVVRHGQHTGARPGRVLYGPGRRETARPDQP
jgi:N-acyl-D-aspartate/D-glutamate deacylase